MDRDEFHDPLREYMQTNTVEAPSEQFFQDIAIHSPQIVAKMQAEDQEGWDNSKRRTYFMEEAEVEDEPDNDNNNNNSKRSYCSYFEDEDEDEDEEDEPERKRPRRSARIALQQQQQQQQQFDDDDIFS